MKILVICQYYYPEPFRLNDICEEMVKRGHEVTVITGVPNYPEGQIYTGYERHAHVDEVINGVKVHRCPIIPRKTGIIFRILNYFSYPYQAKKYIKKIQVSSEKPFDVVFVNQLSPVIMAEPAIHYKKKHGTPILMYCLDLWPESLVAGGINRGSVIYKAFHKISSHIYKKMDRILVTSRMFSKYLEQEFGVKEDVIDYLPQYAERLFEKLPYREPDEIINLVFAGNIGAVQSVETIVEAAKQLKERTIHFHIVGGGTDLERLKVMAEGLDNVTFYGRRSLEEMIAFYSMADAMLVTLKADPVLSLTLPGKVQSYMATGKPIVGAIGGETKKIIEEAKCGYCGNAEDADELARNIRLFVKCGDKKLMGRNARAFYDAHFARDRFMEKMERELERIV